jgi:hypothetical protein
MGGVPRSPYAFDDLVFMDAQPSTAGGPQRVRRAFDVVPGAYDVYVAVKERGAAGADGSGGAAGAAGTQKVGVLKQEIEAPDLSGRVFTTSSVILAESVELMNTALPPDKQAENPYTIGPMKIVPSASGKFSTKGAVGVIFWIYGAKGHEATKKPDITVDYKFYRKTGDQETYFNKTAPQELNAQTLPPGCRPRVAWFARAPVDCLPGRRLPAGNRSAGQSGRPEAHAERELLGRGTIGGTSCGIARLRWSNGTRHDHTQHSRPRGGGGRSRGRRLRTRAACRDDGYGYMALACDQTHVEPAGRIHHQLRA